MNPRWHERGDGDHCPGEGCPVCSHRQDRIEDERERSSDREYDGWAADAAAADAYYKEPL